MCCTQSYNRRTAHGDLFDSRETGGAEMKKFATVGATVAVALSIAPAAPAAVHIKTLSNRADLVSGGDVLVRVTAPARKLSALKITAAGRDVTGAFTARGPSTLEGIVS